LRLPNTHQPEEQLYTICRGGGGVERGRCLGHTIPQMASECRVFMPARRALAPRVSSHAASPKKPTCSKDFFTTVAVIITRSSPNHHHFTLVSVPAVLLHLFCIYVLALINRFDVHIFS